MRDPALVQVPGPLAPFAEGFRVRLAVMGYTRDRQAVHLRLMAQVSSWLSEHELDCSALDASLVGEFVCERRSCGCRDARSPRSLGPLLEYLQELGAVRQPTPKQPTGPVDTMLADYAGYLARERGLAAGTIERHVSLVWPFLTGRVAGGVLELETLTAADVTAFMLACSHHTKPATVQRAATAVRSLLRFLHLRGHIGSALVGAVPAAANWKLAGLPKHLTADQLRALLGSCDLETAVGRRDKAIMMLLARLGLRAGEAAALRLEDIDWRRAEIAVRGKGNRHERLPLPADVGEAIVAYLCTDRPAAATGLEVFAGIRAPHRALTRGAVTQLVARAARRCGLPTIYAHRLRHTAATGMLAAGASLEEVGQVLRHRHALTTAIYAKVDDERLRMLARPWPGESV